MAYVIMAYIVSNVAVTDMLVFFLEKVTDSRQNRLVENRLDMWLARTRAARHAAGDADAKATGETEGRRHASDGVQAAGADTRPN